MCSYHLVVTAAVSLVSSGGAGGTDPPHKTSGGLFDNRRYSMKVNICFDEEYNLRTRQTRTGEVKQQNKTESAD